MATDLPTLVMTGNGPGEIAGWVLPIATEMRRSDGTGLNLILVLSPSQFASGNEAALAARSGLFNEIVSPGQCARLALGWGHLALGRPAALLHLGGDFWWSRRLAARWAIPALAYVESDRFARHYRAFQTIFVPYPNVSGWLTARGVDSARIQVVGDPRVDYLPVQRRGNGEARAPRVVFLSGSRERVMRLLFPLWAETALLLRGRVPQAEIAIAVYPYLPTTAIDEAVAPWRERFAREGVTVQRETTRQVVADVDLVITIPGTSTMEVAAVPVTALVVIPTQLAAGFTLEGAGEFILRAPLVGPLLRRAFAPQWVLRQRVRSGQEGSHSYAALPNRLREQAILPELVGVVTAARLAEEAAALLADDSRRRRIEATLQEAAGPRGAAARIATHLNTILRPHPATAPRV